MRRAYPARRHGGGIYAGCRKRESEFLNLYVLEPNFVAMVLQQNIAALMIAEVFPVLVFAVRDECVPHLVVALILEHFHSVEPMLYMVAAHDNSGVVEVVDVERFFLRRWNKVVERAEFAVAFYAEFCVGVASSSRIWNSQPMAEPSPLLASGSTKYFTPLFAPFVILKSTESMKLP